MMLLSPGAYHFVDGQLVVAPDEMQEVQSVVLCHFCLVGDRLLHLIHPSANDVGGQIEQLDTRHQGTRYGERVLVDNRLFKQPVDLGKHSRLLTCKFHAQGDQRP